MRRRPYLLVTVACALVLAACTRDAEESSRNVFKARERYAEARQARDKGDDQRAIELLREAVAYDACLGEAHNDLGVLFERHGQLYAAAVAFEAARKNLPGDPRPRHNLAVVLAKGGRIDDALAACAAALEVQADYIPAVQTLAWLHLRYERADEMTASHLRTVRLRGTDKGWRDWAGEQLIKLEARSGAGP